MGTKRIYRDKDYTCPRCGKSVENLNRLEQDAHEVECLLRTKLDEYM